MITYQTDLDIYPGKPPVVIKLSQYDTDFTLIFNLYASRGLFTIASGTTAAFREKKPDGNIISVNATLDITNKRVTVAPTEAIAKQITAIDGKCACELTLLNGSDELNTANFVLFIEKAPVDKDAVTSDSVVRELIEVTDQAEEIIAAAERVTEAIDPTLTQEGRAADAKATGDQIRVMEPMLWTPDIKTTLLECFRNVAWLNDESSQIYEALRAALYANEYPKIIAVYTPGTDPVYTDDSLVDLKQHINVRFYESASSAGVVIPSSDYSLSGTLVEGVSNLVVTYNQYQTLVAITDVIDYYNISKWVMDDNAVRLAAGGETGLADETRYPSRLAYYFNTKRQTLVVLKGKAPFYAWNQTAVPTIHYPIPVPRNANHVKITAEPVGQNTYFHTVPYDEATNKYGNSIVNNRISWGEMPSGYIEKDIENPGNLFAVVNFRYNSTNPVYPSDPTKIEVEFSEV